MKFFFAKVSHFLGEFLLKNQFFPERNKNPTLLEMSLSTLSTSWEELWTTQTLTRSPIRYVCWSWAYLYLLGQRDPKHWPIFDKVFGNEVLRAICSLCFCCCPSSAEKRKIDNRYRIVFKKRFAFRFLSSSFVIRKNKNIRKIPDHP